MISTVSIEALAGTLPRTPLAVLPTPLVAAPRLAPVLGTGPLLVKRDDLTAFAFGGNKARLLEFLVAAAIAAGADTLLTGGAAGSNFCAATAAAARRAGLARECLRLLGAEQEPGPADVTVVDARGPGHGLPSPDGLAAAEQAMRTEGLMLDPVYTAKALAQAPRSGSVVFWHTGGILDAVAAAQEASS